MSLTRSLDDAKKAYAKKDVKAAIAAHKAASAPEEHNPDGEYLKSAVYGGLDGTITTFAVVAGVTGAALAPGIILIMGFANLLGDGISMAVGDYLSTRAENEYIQSERVREAWEVENYPQGERQEMVEIYQQKGIPKADAKKMVAILSKHKKAWVDVMMVEELGLVASADVPIKNALITFASFCFFGFMPLAAYVAALLVPSLAPHAFEMGVGLTGATLFTLGALKTRLTQKSWAFSGLEMLAVGSLAAGAAYLVGMFLAGLA